VTARYAETGSNRPSRHPERADYDAATVHGILDAGLVAHTGFIAGGRPHVLPLLYVRRGEQLYLHGSTGAHLFRLAARAESVPVVVEVTLFDGLVLARSFFDHSVNYRSVVVAGEAVLVRDPAVKLEVMHALVEHLVPGRGRDARPPSDDELRQTGVVELALEEVSAKVRRGDPVDEPEDLDRPCWAGTVPLEVRWGVPRPAGDQLSGIELPDYLRELGGPAGSL
jgi:nitroimidazol reductase NimA-like FMN-containing flavoprotein (pyridoxamine 5'-phosphate oxidase superfamily)